MLKKSFWRILVVSALGFGFFTNVELVGARRSLYQAPQVPELVIPQDGATADSNPPTLCARSVDANKDSVQIKFEVNGGGEGDHISPWIDTNGIGLACWTDNTPWTSQTHSWQARTLDPTTNLQSGASPQWKVNIPSPPQPEETCSVDDFSPDKSAPQVVGTVVNFTINVSCTSGVNEVKVFVDGNNVAFARSSFVFEWNTSGYNPGNRVVSVDVKGVNGGSAGRSHPYDLTANVPPPLPPQEPSQPNPNSGFGNCEAIKIGSDVFIITKEGSAIQRRHVPNPTTLNALGFGQSAINNKGFTDDQLKTIGQGSDIPDIAVDPNGFATFKATFCSGSSPIVPANPAQPQQNGPSGTVGDCPASPTQLKPGDIAVVAGKDLNLRPKAGVDNTPIIIIPSFSKLTIISGPVCSGGTRWYEVKYNGHDGWAAEVGSGGEYHMYPVTSGTTQPQVPAVPPNQTQPNNSPQNVPNPEPANSDGHTGEQRKICELVPTIRISSVFSLFGEWFVLEIPTTVVEPYEIWFMGNPVPNTADGVQHIGFQAETDPTKFALGISKRFSLLHGIFPIWDKSNWKIEYPC